MSGVTIRRIVVRGRVQRVGYRHWTQQTAIAHGLDGWVRNCPDGSVEALFAGSAAAVEAMIEACRRGPQDALVDTLDLHDAGPVELVLRSGKSFAVLPTG